MKGKLLLLAGAAVGYIFGTRAGRERYEQIKQNATKAWNDPRVQEKVSEAEHFVSETASKTVPQVQEKISDAVGAARTRFSGSDETGQSETGYPTTDPARPDPVVRSQNEYVRPAD
ncbi:MAG TPA: YtxH domain-containing protein [Jiangellaceae bacterium]|nr:YtxH domain-containing protein [Jiangellaceae bacterium]